MVVQSVLIPSSWKFEDALSYLETHGYKFLKVDETPKYYRFRQQEPNPDARYFTTSLRNGVKLVNFHE